MKVFFFVVLPRVFFFVPPPSRPGEPLAAGCPPDPASQQHHLNGRAGSVENPGSGVQEAQCRRVRAYRKLGAASTYNLAI
jgi:hypothetical protein